MLFVSIVFPANSGSLIIQDPHWFINLRIFSTGSRVNNRIVQCTSVNLVVVNIVCRERCCTHSATKFSLEDTDSLRLQRTRTNKKCQAETPCCSSIVTKFYCGVELRSNLAYCSNITIVKTDQSRGWSHQPLWNEGHHHFIILN